MKTPPIRYGIMNSNGLKVRQILIMRIIRFIKCGIE
jgi:hypothetical protein